jgi:hypothetical protein
MYSTSGSSRSASSASPTPSEEQLELWAGCQEILAERTSITGANEYLVVYKTAWVPVHSFTDDFSVVRRFKESVKMKFASGSGAMSIKLPVEPGTVLARDCEKEKILSTAATARAPATVAAKRDHTLRALYCPCALCAMHAKH